MNFYNTLEVMKNKAYIKKNVSSLIQLLSLPQKGYFIENKKRFA